MSNTELKNLEEVEVVCRVRVKVLIPKSEDNTRSRREELAAESLQETLMQHLDTEAEVYDLVSL